METVIHIIKNIFVITGNKIRLICNSFTSLEYKENKNNFLLEI
jgi:hypothetical protein